MARITLDIEAESASDLRDTIIELATGFGLRAVLGVEDTGDYSDEGYAEEPAVAATQDAEPPKRTRRTKAQIEAERAASAAPVVAAEVFAQPTPIVDQAALDAAAETALMGGAATPVTYEQCQEVLRAVLTKYRGVGKSPMGLGAVLKAAAGADNLSSVDPSRYGDALAALQAELAG